MSPLEPDRPSRSRTRIAGVPWWDVVLTTALVVGALGDTLGRTTATHPWSDATALLTVGAVVLRTRAPRAMLALSGLGILGYAATPAPDTGFAFFVALMVIAFTVGAAFDGRTLVLATTWLLLVGYVLQVRVAETGPPLAWADVWLSPIVLVGAPLGAGQLVRRARRQTALLRQLSAELAAEREAHAEAAVAAERTRIARELHDVVAHSVTVMVVQAGAAESTLEPGGRAWQQVHALRDTGREALAELRRALGVLRPDADEAVDAAPLPTVDDLPRLVAAAGASLDVDDDAGRDLPPGLALAAYRIVQEALTNATRHASGSPVAVTVRRTPAVLEVDVRDAGGRPSGASGAGRGLTGMRERVALYDGELDVGPYPGGWRVRARLPLARVEEPV